METLYLLTMKTYHSLLIMTTIVTMIMIMKIAIHQKLVEWMRQHLQCLPPRINNQRQLLWLRQKVKRDNLATLRYFSYFIYNRVFLSVAYKLLTWRQNLTIFCRLQQIYFFYVFLCVLF